ncbi:MAG: hypothetical protein ACTSV2_04850 [Candidatus Thorarchaeota archaeon]
MCKGEILLKVRKVIPCLLLIVALVLPVLLSSPVQAATDYDIQVAQDEYENLGTIEAIVTNVDPWGGVKNDITSFQNATKYGYTHLNAYQNIVSAQADTDNGFVSLAQLEVSQKTVYPNGVIGGPMVGLTLQVNPIVVITADATESYVVWPTAEEAILLATEVAIQYETDLGITLSRLAVTAQGASTGIYHAPSDTYISNYSARSYQVQFVSLLDFGAGAAALNTLRTRLSLMGGFMEMVNAPNWPVDDSILSETLFFGHHSEETGYAPSMDNPYYFYGQQNSPFVRAASVHVNYTESFNLGVLGMAGFLIPAYIADVAGDETYSLKQHIGYGNNIQSKGHQTPTIGAISSIAGITPTGFDMSGPASTWEYFDETTEVNNPYPLSLMPGVTIPANATVEEFVEPFVVWYPRLYALSYISSIFSVGPTTFDTYVDLIWGGSGPYPDIKEMYLELNYTEGAESAAEHDSDSIRDLNRDLLQAIMGHAGFTADTLLTYVDEDIFELSPTLALVEAFISYFDSYNLLDILQNTTYSNPVVLESFLNGYIEDLESFLIDFAGIDLPSSYENKEAFAALIEDHFGLVLQGLFDAMADFTGNTTAIKDSLHGMLVTDHIVEEIYPYFWTDLYSSFVSEYDYGLYLNFDPITPLPPSTYPELETMDITDIVMTFDIDREGVTYVGPHIIVEKTVVDRELLEGELLDVTITVKNIGSAAAHDIKVFDGITPGFVSDKQYYWNKATLAAGETWTVSVTAAATALGMYAEVPTIVCYFNATLDSFNATLGPEYWDGAALYTISEVGNQIAVVTFLEQTVLGIPLYIVIMIGGIAVVVVVIVIIKKRP